MIDINNIKLNTSVQNLDLSTKLLNRFKLSHVDTFQQMMEVDTSKWENVVASKVISGMRAVQAKYKDQYAKLLQQQKPAEPKPSEPAPTTEAAQDLEGEAYARLTNTSFAVPSTHEQRRFFVANNILNAYVLSGRLQDEDGPLPVVMREIVKVADAFMDAIEGKPYVEEEDQEIEEEVIVPIPTVETAASQQKSSANQKQAQEQKSNFQKQSNSKKKDRNKKQESRKQESNKEKDAEKVAAAYAEAYAETEEETATAPTEEIATSTLTETSTDSSYETTPVEVVDVVDVVEDEEGIYVPVSQTVITDDPQSEYAQTVDALGSEEPEQFTQEVVEESFEEPVVEPAQVSEGVVDQKEEQKPAQKQSKKQSKKPSQKPSQNPSQRNQKGQQKPQQQDNALEAQHPIAEHGEHIAIVKYLGRGKRGSKYFQAGDILTVKRMRKEDDGVIVVSATINDKNVCFDSKHYTWSVQKS